MEAKINDIINLENSANFVVVSIMQVEKQEYALLLSLADCAKCIIVTEKRVDKDLYYIPVTNEYLAKTLKGKFNSVIKAKLKKEFNYDVEG